MALQYDTSQPSNNGEQSEKNTTDNGTATLDTSQKEIQDLSTGGTEELPQEPSAESGSGAPGQQEGLPPASGFTWRDLGPGVLSGMAGNDSSAVTSYSVDGAVNGYGQLRRMVLSRAH